VWWRWDGGAARAGERRPWLGSSAVGKEVTVDRGEAESDKTEEPRHPAARHWLVAALPHFICIIKASSDG